MDQNYTVKQLAKMAGISVRTLHLYDELKLLRPAIRTRAGYRMYGEKELLRLQQILFYKELDFPLKNIGQILDEPDFDIIQALEGHKKALGIKKARINTLLKTIDNTLKTLKNKTMLCNL
jgi:DNA-binding transcriptional MerR regulator